jgi:hypothetical protein
MSAAYASRSRQEAAKTTLIEQAVLYLLAKFTSQKSLFSGGVFGEIIRYEHTYN